MDGYVIPRLEFVHGTESGRFSAVLFRFRLFLVIRFAGWLWQQPKLAGGALLHDLEGKLMQGGKCSHVPPLCLEQQAVDAGNARRKFTTIILAHGFTSDAWIAL
jgi:hypothetical protein